MRHVLICSLLLLPFAAKAQRPSCCAPRTDSASSFSCKLTTEELRKRKATVLASLKEQVLERTELDNGYSYCFTGTDAVVDELNTFIRTERECCTFFTFRLTVAGDKSSACLELLGPPGVKDVIRSELDL